MKANEYTEKDTILKVVGHIWQGQKCTYEYSLNRKAHPKTLAEAKSIAGDFQSLESARIIETERKIVETIKTTKLT